MVVLVVVVVVVVGFSRFEYASTNVSRPFISASRKQIPVCADAVEVRRIKITRVALLMEQNRKTWLKKPGVTALSIVYTLFQTIFKILFIFAGAQIFC